MAVDIFLGEPPAHIKQWIIEHATPPGPVPHADTRFTLEDGTVETYNITGILNRQWMIDNGYYKPYDIETGEGDTWLKIIVQADIGNTVTSVGDYAFTNNSSLTSVTMFNSVTSIGEDAFSACSGLTSVTLSESLTNIGVMAFTACSGLTSVTIPESVTSIDVAAFAECTGLTSMTIPDGVMSIGGSAFEGCTNLTTIMVMGKTTVDAQTLLADASVPEGCTIVGELG